VTAEPADASANPRFWDGIAEKYSRQPVEDPAAFDRKIAFTKEHLGPGRVLLDVGCGTGSLALRLADTGADVHGLDVSSEMIRIANDKKAAQGADNVTFHVGAFDDAFEAIEPASLDVLCAYSLLHLAGDRPAMLARAHRLLKPGGAFISSTLCLRESWVPFGLIIGAMRLVGKAPHVATFTKKTLAEEIRQAGFENVREVDVGAKPTVAFMAAEKPR
jgi:ubiquinone/menaquinone biosynthesis C-methylase UbiE